MKYITYLLDEIMSILDREKEFYTMVLQQSPEGSLICEKRGGGFRYLHSTPLGKDASGVHSYKRVTITDKPDMVRALIGKEYAIHALKRIKHNVEIIDNTRNGFMDMSPRSIINETGIGRKKAMISLPAITGRSATESAWAGRAGQVGTTENHGQSGNEITIQEIAGKFGSADARSRAWAEEEYEQNPHKPEGKSHCTSRGLLVRSRAELLIAEILYKYDIPFRYEQKIRIGTNELFPDFTFLDKNGDEFYWEHCGMMDDPTYLNNFRWKRGLYEGAGIGEWTDMIYSFDNDGNIDMRQIEAIVKLWVLPRVS